MKNTDQVSIASVQDEMARLHDLAEAAWMAAADLQDDEQRGAMRALMAVLSEGITKQITALDTLKEAA